MIRWMRTVAVTLTLGLSVLVTGACGDKKPADTVPLQTIATETTEVERGVFGNITIRF